MGLVDLLMNLDSTVFLFLLASLIYGSYSSALGQVPRLLVVAESLRGKSFKIKNLLNFFH